MIDVPKIIVIRVRLIILTWGVHVKKIVLKDHIHSDDSAMINAMVATYNVKFFVNSKQTLSQSQVPKVM